MAYLEDLFMMLGAMGTIVLFFGLFIPLRLSAVLMIFGLGIILFLIGKGLPTGLTMAVVTTIGSGFLTVFLGYRFAFSKSAGSISILLFLTPVALLFTFSLLGLIIKSRDSSSVTGVES